MAEASLYRFNSRIIQICVIVDRLSIQLYVFLFAKDILISILSHRQLVIMGRIQTLVDGVPCMSLGFQISMSCKARKIYLSRLRLFPLTWSLDRE